MEDARLTKRSIDIDGIKDVVVINAQIGFDVQSFNLSIYVRDRAMLEENIIEAKTQLNNYLDEIYNTAISMGWNIFDETTIK